jgi:thiamine biosynthesis lipoprotein
MGVSVFILEGFEALGTKWYIEVFEAITAEKKETMHAGITSFIRSFEGKYSRFKKDSLLSQLNEQRSLPYDHDLAEMLRIGKVSYEKSGGVFNLFIKDALVKKGYGQGEIKEIVSDDMSDFYLDEKQITLTGEKSIDLGGIGKGYLIDLLAAFLQRKYSMSQFLINGGGDMYMTHNSDQPIEVFLQNPIQRDILLGSLYLKNQAFCASSSYVRAWEKDGIRKNHFITSGGREVWAASFTVGNTATIADIAATVLCITSADKEKTKKFANAFEVDYLVYDDTGAPYGALEVIHNI